MAAGQAGGREDICQNKLWPSECSDLSPDPAIVRTVLDNGFRMVFRKNQEPKNRVAAYLVVRAGSLNESEDQRGIAHFLEHMMFNGTTHYPSGTLIPHLQKMGMEFGRDSNAQTTYDSTVYHLVLPDTTRKTLIDGFTILADFATGALLQDKDIDQERGIILAEKRSRDSEAYRNYVALGSVAYAGTRLAGHEIIGLPEVLHRADHDLLEKFYKTWYRPDNMVLVVVGDLEPQVGLEAARQVFSKLIRPDEPLPQMADFGSLHKQKFRTWYHHSPKIGKTEISIESYKDLPLVSDSLVLEKQDLIRYMVPMILGYRLREFEEGKNGVCSDSSASFGDLLKRIGYTTIAAESSSGDWQKCLSQLEKIRRQALTYGFTEAEVARAAKEIQTLLEQRKVTAAAIDSRRMAKTIIRHLLRNRVYQSPEQEFELYGQFVNDIRVDQLNDALQRGWNKEYVLVSVSGNADLGDAAEQRIAEVYQKSQKGAVARLAKNGPVVFPYLKTIGKKQSIYRSKKYPETAVETIHFQNNLVVNLRQSDFEPGSFRFVASFGSGRQASSTPGIELLAEEVIGSSGTGRYTSSEMEEVMAGKTVSMAFNIGATSFAWSGQGLTKDLTFCVQLLRTLLEDPGFRKPIFDKRKEELRHLYQGLTHRIDGAFPLHVESFLAGDDKRFGLPPWKDIAQLDFVKVQQWSLSNLVPNDLEISVVGDFDRDQVVELLGRYFGGLNLKSPKKKWLGPVRFPGSKALRVDVDSGVNKGLAALAWSTDDFSDIHENRGIFLLSRILEDRLRKEVRERLGKAYSPSVANFGSRAFKNYGYLLTQATVAPQEVHNTLQVIGAIGADLAKNGVQENELENARLPVLNGLKQMMENNGYWLHNVLVLSSRFPEQLRWPETILQDFSSFTGAELTKLAKKYIREAAVVSVLPIQGKGRKFSPGANGQERAAVHP